MKNSSSARDIIDRALRLTGLSLAALAAELGMREATLYKARGGHIALSGKARKALEHFLARGTAPQNASNASLSALRSAKLSKSTIDPIAEQLAFLKIHATPDEWQILSDTVASFHRRVAARHNVRRNKTQS